MPIERRPQARRVLKNAKAQGTPQAEIDEAMMVMVNKGTPSERLKRRLQRWGFDAAEADALITANYPQPPQ